MRAPAGPSITQCVILWEWSLGTNTCSLGDLNWKQKSPWRQQTWVNKSKACWSVFIWILFYFILFSTLPKARHSSFPIKNNGLRNVLLEAPHGCVSLHNLMCLEGRIVSSGPAESESGCLHVSDLDPRNSRPGAPRKMVFGEQCLLFLLFPLLHLFKWCTVKFPPASLDVRRGALGKVCIFTERA